MRKLFVAAIVTALSATSTLAADLPSIKGPPPAPLLPPPPLWTGFYAGLNAGYGWGTTTNATTVSAPLFDGVALAANNLDPRNQLLGTGLNNGITALANSGVANVNKDGFIGGGQIGYNWQFKSVFVAGLETDIQGSTIRGSGSYGGASQDRIAWLDPFGIPPFINVGGVLLANAGLAGLAATLPAALWASDKSRLAWTGWAPFVVVLAISSHPQC
jgi:outer membrane immunogenic protein